LFQSSAGEETRRARVRNDQRLGFLSIGKKWRPLDLKEAEIRYLQLSSERAVLESSEEAVHSRERSTADVSQLVDLCDPPNKIALEGLGRKVECEGAYICWRDMRHGGFCGTAVARERRLVQQLKYKFIRKTVLAPEASYSLYKQGRKVCSSYLGHLQPF